MGFDVFQASWGVSSVETIVILCVLALIVVRCSTGAKTHAVVSFIQRFARRKSLAVFSCGALVIMFRLLLIPVLGLPRPIWQDEYSFLLAGDTFAHGRLTNPTHPMWKHMESFHILEKPTYQSMYPPGEGVVLAAGEKLGNPWIGQLISTALMCSAICWMLQGWLPPGWALLGGILVWLRLGVLCYWLDSYFCASLPAVGGALVLGALPRIKKHARYRDAICMGLGLVILANTRPYEGFVFALPVAAMMGVWLLRQKSFPKRQLFSQVVTPLVFILALGGMASSFYFWRVTGNPFRMPYQVNRETYAIAPYFVWGSPRPAPTYRFAEMRRFYELWEYRDYRRNRTFVGFAKRLREKVERLWACYLGPLMTMPLLGLPWLFRDRRMRFPLLLALIFGLGLVVEVWTEPHYAAPATALLFLLIIQCMRHLRLWNWRQRPIGNSLLHAIPMLALAMVALRVSAIACGAPLEQPWPKGNLIRESIREKLESEPGKQLVIVHYALDHWSILEFVYNDADIDDSKVVWARDMGRAANEELLQYFHDRKVWLLRPDDEPITLRPYNPAPSHAETSLRTGN